MRKIYLCLAAFAASMSLTAQTVTIGTSTTTPSGSTYRSPFSPLYGYSFAETIYLQSEINTSGSIVSLKFNYSGVDLNNSSAITLWMGTVSRGAFATTADWEPVTNLTKVFDGTISYTSLPGIVTVNLTTPFNYQNTGNLIIAIDENTDGYATGPSFYASEVGTARTIYFNDDAINPDPSALPTADGIRTKVGNIQITFGTPTPVSLTGFTGEKLAKSNKLSWVTKTEINNKGFELQRSVDGVKFSPISFTATKAIDGNSTASIDYSTIDAKPLAGTNYYRLNQLDKDGKSTISQVVTIKAAATTALTINTIYPNPVKNAINLMVASPLAQPVNVFVTDAKGTIIWQQNTQLINGENKLTINAATFKAGVYIVKIQDMSGAKTASTRFVKQ